MARSPAPPPDRRASVTVSSPQAPATAGSTGARGRLLVFSAALAVLVLAVDQATKIAALGALDEGRYVPVLGDVLGLTLVFNPGAAFSLATGSTWIFTIVAVVVAVVIVRASRKLRSRGWALALGALLGGNLGNLTDRLFRDPGFARGHVVDFINYNGWFVGNVADIAIVGAAIGIALLALLGIGIDGSRARTAEPGPEADTAAVPEGGPDGADDIDEADDALANGGPDRTGGIDSPDGPDTPSRA